MEDRYILWSCFPGRCFLWFARVWYQLYERNCRSFGLVMDLCKWLLNTLSRLLKLVLRSSKASLLFLLELLRFSVGDNFLLNMTPLIYHPLVLVDFPVTASFLTLEERSYVVWRKSLYNAFYLVPILTQYWFRARYFRHR
jgi:hypothetical protein